jgi:CheY-like chemotaxis protein/uncharacterized protein HemY
MKDSFGTQAVSVLIIEPISTLRQLISTSLKDLGFQNVMRYDSLKEALVGLQMPGPKWVITSLCQADDINAFSLLQACIADPKLHDCRVSLLIDDKDKQLLPEAFQLGLLSHHSQVNSAGSLKEEVRRLLNVMRDCEWQNCLVSYHYLAEYLLSRREFDEFERLTRNVLTLFPQNPFVSMKYAYALFLQAQNAKAIHVLRQIKGSSPQYGARIDEMVSSFVGGDLDETNSDISFAQTYDLQAVAVVDPDEATGKGIQQVFKRLGLTDVQTFNDGASFAKWLEKNPPLSLVITEWKLAKMSGAALVQRIRLHHNLDIPIIVHSSVVTEKDRLLLREMGITDVISKPMYHKILVEEIKEIIINERSEADALIIEKQIRSKIRAKDMSAAETLLEKLKQSNAPDYVKDQQEAEVLLAKGQGAEAKKVAIRALNTGGENLLLLDLLGRILLSLREFDLARKFMEKATKSSPHNLERLCALAETTAELGDTAAMQENLDKAKKVDESNKVVIESQVTLATDRGDLNTAKAMVEKLVSSDGFVARLNNKAVYLVNTGNMMEALALYDRALQTLPAKDKDLAGVIHYNMALACIKMGQLTKASFHLTRVGNADETRVGGKSRSLQTRVNRCIETGESLVLKTDNKRDSEGLAALELEHDSNVPVSSEIRPGTHCSYLVYQSKEKFSESALQLMQKQMKLLK